MLETRGLTRHFGGLAAVNQVSIQVNRGEVRSIIGPNGAGKTTLFNLITGGLPPSSGHILFKGEDISRATPARIFHLGMVRSFQVSHLFPALSVRQNIELMAYGRIRQSEHPWAGRRVSGATLQRRIGDALERTATSHLAETPTGTLSHGDRRLVEIAMALAAEPEILLLDEPTAGMSPEETRHTATLLRGLAPDVTLVIVEHDMSVVMSISDRISVLHRGQILAEGSPQDIRAHTEVRDVYLGKSSKH
jgi:branched-chain amino acid transport system ATP-binding protein